MSSTIQHTVDHQPLSCFADVVHVVAQMHMLLTRTLALVNACNMIKIRTCSLPLLRTHRDRCTSRPFLSSRRYQSLPKWHIEKGTRRPPKRQGRFRSHMQLQRRHHCQSGRAHGLEKRARAQGTCCWAPARYGLHLCQREGRSLAVTPSTSKKCFICRNKFYSACARHYAVARVHGARAQHHHRTR